MPARRRRPRRKVRPRRSGLPNVRRLVRILDRLRDPGGCPWDREQDHRSLRPYLLEETHEVLDAIDAGDDARIEEELGDLLLQVIFHARLGAERGAFDLDSVAAATCAKLIERHPHVFGTLRVSGTREVLENWERIKARRRRGGVLAGLPPAAPALLRAFRAAEKLGRTGGAAPEAEARRALLREARRIASSRRPRARGFGDLLLAAAFLAARRGVDPESALREALAAHIRRHVRS